PLIVFCVQSGVFTGEEKPGSLARVTWKEHAVPARAPLLLTFPTRAALVWETSSSGSLAAVGAGTTKAASTVFAALIVTVHSVPVGLGQLFQPPNCEPGTVGVAVRVTTLPSSNSFSHSPGQLMPAGELLTVPVPLPDSLSVSLNFFLSNFA